MNEPTGLPPKPRLLEMRWVCGLCLNVRKEPLHISWKWSISKTKSIEGCWIPIGVSEPHCHGRPMLVAGKPKLDTYGSGLMVDPVLNLRCPKVETARV